MGKKSKGNQRLDKYYYLAKEQGYRSRAAFKLVQLNRKYGFLEKANSCLDLCAAPGGWLQVASKHMPMHSLVVGVDLDPIKPIKGVITHQADITTERCRQILRKEARGGMYDIVIHDGAPNVGGNWASEAHMQNVLVLESLKLACEFLPPNGWFVTKVFRSVDYHSLLYAFNQLFRTVEATKPMASRYQSAEIFVVCGGFKAPGKIDERLLDAKHLFNDTSAEPIPVVDVLDPKQQKKRQRQGYEDGISTTYSERSVLDFLVSEAPVEMLGRTIKFTFEGDDQKMMEFVMAAKATTEEIQHLCSDLPVLGRSDFKHLLKWRMGLRKGMEREGLLAKKSKKEANNQEEEEKEEELDEESKLLREMQQVGKRLESRLKREKKKAKKIKQASKLRIAMSHHSDGGDIFSEQDLFRFDKDQLKSMNHVEAPGERLMEQLEEDSESEEPLVQRKKKGEEEEGEAKDEKEKYLESQDKYFELLYRHYKGLKSETNFTKKRSRLDDITEIDVENFDINQRERESAYALKSKTGGKKGKDKETNEEDAKVDSMASKWFSQDVFDDVDMTQGENANRQAKKKATQEEADSSDTETSESEEEDEAAFLEAKRKERDSRRGDQADDDYKPKREGEGDGDFEIVKQQAQASEDEESSSDSDSLDSDDTEAIAHSMVLKKMFLKTKTKRELVDSSYNKYAFHDEGLPHWFTQDEAKHMRPAVELPEAELAAARDQLKAIDSRTIKKVAEAKARKKRKLWKRMEAARSKANQIASSEDMSARGKAREISKLYANARNLKGGKGDKDGKKSGSKRISKASGKPLDRRMFSDKRQVNAKQKKKDARKKKGKGGGRR